MAELCVVCHTKPGRVCSPCQDDIDNRLANLPARLGAVAGVLVPGRAATDERVAMSAHVHSSLPARSGALSLIGPGGDVPATLHPLVRHWHVTRTVEVTRLDDGRAHTVRVRVTDWFSEAVIDGAGKPVMIPDDQIGTVPPREWLDMQVRRWRVHFGHHVPARTMLGDQRTYVPAAYRTLLPLPAGPQLIGFLAAAHRASGAAARLAYRGLLTAHPDPVVDAIERRARPGSPPRSMKWDVDYLRTWLDKACAEPALDLAGFAAQLHALHAEIGHVLGDTPDRTWLGRCPAFIADVDPDGEPTGKKRPCGAGLWQENGAFISAQVQCPRCRTTWDTRGHAGAGTAREIRRVWPIDRRRRYTVDKVDRLRPPPCPGCGQRVTIEWRDATGTHDKERTWQPVAARCPTGCDEARRVL